MNYFYDLPNELQEFILKKAHIMLMSNVIKVIKRNSRKFVLRTRWSGHETNYPPQRWVIDNGPRCGASLEEIYALRHWEGVLDILLLDSPIFDFKYKTKSEMFDQIQINNVKVYKSWTKASMVKAWIKI